METGETRAEADEKILQPSPGGPRHLVASRRTRGVQADEKPPAYQGRRQKAKGRTSSHFFSSLGQPLETQASDDGLHIFTQHW